MGRQDIGRGRPFQFILNHSRATATNVYLMLYPKPDLGKVILEEVELVKEVCQRLNQIYNEAHKLRQKKRKNLGRIREDN